MTARLDETLAALLLDVDTAPDGAPLDEAMDTLLDWVQETRGALLAALAPQPLPEPAPGQTVIRYVDKATLVLRGFLLHVLSTEMVTFVPGAVSRRGTAYIPTPCPATMTEDQFQVLLEAEAEALDHSGDEAGAIVLRQDLNRRRLAFEAQARRDAQIAALAPLPGRLPRPAVLGL